MKRTPITTFLMTILTVLLCLGLPARIWACTECICFTDESCANDDCDVTPNGNYARTIFSPSCTGYYSFATSAVCEGSGDCKQCRVCANLFQLDGVNEVFVTNANCHNANCGQECRYDCSASGSYVNLDATKTYVMYVSKLHCFGSSCEDCSDDCKVYACLSIGMSGGSCVP